ncbi:MAG: hypothetical protein NTZ14_02910 [Hyphomicrobiales bacterium]|nr:hypothetical protein [Hyphomicrobiales bacterium]
MASARHGLTKAGSGQQQGLQSLSLGPLSARNEIAAALLAGGVWLSAAVRRAGPRTERRGIEDEFAPSGFLSAEFDDMAGPDFGAIDNTEW